jgi:PAS domain S-box-containing protein
VVGKRVELTERTKGGTEFPLELSLSAWKSGKEIFFTSIIRDITERRKSRQLLRESEAAFASWSGA